MDRSGHAERSRFPEGSAQSPRGSVGGPMTDPGTAPTSAPPTLSTRRLRQLRLLAALLAVTLVYALSEVFFRFIRPPPRVALVRGSQVDDFHLAEGGVPVWKFPELHRPPCSQRRPGAPRISFLGSSITYGVGLKREETLPSLVEEDLAHATPAPCSDDLAEPGFASAQQLAVARVSLTAAPSALVVWEDWDPSKVYSAVGDFAFDARGRDLDARGVPVVAFVPSFVGDPLFRFSAAYEYATLALVPRAETFDEMAPLDHVCKDMLGEVQQRARVSGGKLVVLQAVALDRGFDVPRGPTSEQVIADCARQRGIPVFSIAQILADQPVEAVRLDPCCHLNAHGHALLAERLAPKLAALLSP